VLRDNQNHSSSDNREHQKPWGNSGCGSEWGGLDIVGGHGRIQGGEQVVERTAEGSCSRLQEPELPHGFWYSRRSRPSAPTCFERGFDGGKKIKGIKVHLAVDKYNFPLAINVSPANRHGPWQRYQAVQQGHCPGAASARRSRLQGDRPG
jgi:hypothetical protein